MDKLRPQQVDAASLTLAAAFRDDPLLKLLHPDERKRSDIAPWLFGTVINYGMPYEQVWANEDASAVAVWLPLDGTDMSAMGMIRAGIGSLPLKVGARRAIRFMQSISAAEHYHKAVGGPHWYLLSVGTRPERQGQGLGLGKRLRSHWAGRRAGLHAELYGPATLAKGRLIAPSSAECMKEEPWIESALSRSWY